MPSRSISAGEAVQIKNALGKVKSEPQSSLLCIRRFLYRAMAGSFPDEETEETSDEINKEEDEGALAAKEKAKIDQGYVDLYEFLITEGKTQFIEDLVNFFEVPYVKGSEEDIFHDREPISSAASIISSLVECAQDSFIPILEKHQYFPRLIEAMSKQWPVGNMQRVNAASAIGRLQYNEQFIKDMKHHLETENPLFSAATIEMLQSFSWGSDMSSMLIKAGAIESVIVAFSRVSATTSWGQIDRPIRAFRKFWLMSRLDIAEDSKEVSQELGGAEDEPDLATDDSARSAYIKLMVKQKAFTPSALRTIYEAWLEIADVNGITLLCHLMDDLQDAEGSSPGDKELLSQVVQERIQRLRAPDPSGSEYSPDSFITPICAFLFHTRIDGVRLSLGQTEGLITFLVDYLASPLPPLSDSPPFIIAHLAAQGLAIMLLAGGWTHIKVALDDPTKFKSLLATSVRIADYFEDKSFKDQGWPKGLVEGSSQLILWLARILSEEPESNYSTTFKEYFKELFAATRPEYGGGGAFAPILADAWSNFKTFCVEAGAVPYLFRVLNTFEIGSEPWEKAALAISGFAVEENTVDLFEENQESPTRLEAIKKGFESWPSSNDDYTRQSNTVKAALEILWGVVTSASRNGNVETLEKLENGGSVDLFCKAIINANIRMDARLAAKNALEAMIDNLDSAREQFFPGGQQGGFLPALVALAFGKVSQEEKDRLVEDFKDIGEYNRPSTSAFIKTLAKLYFPAPRPLVFDDDFNIVEPKPGSERKANPLIPPLLHQELSSRTTLKQKSEILPVLSLGIADESNGERTLRPALIEAGLFPFIYSILEDPEAKTFDLDPSITVGGVANCTERRAVELIRDTLGRTNVESHGYQVKASLEDIRFISLCAKIIQSTTSLQERWLSFAALQETVECAPTLDEKWKVFEYDNHLVVKLAVEELKRAPGTGIDTSMEEDIDVDTRKFREVQPKKYSCRLLTNLLSGASGDDVKANEVKTFYNELGVLNAAKPMKKRSAIREPAKTLIDLLRGEGTDRFDSEAFEDACNTILNGKTPDDERAMSFEELTEMMESQQARSTLFEEKRPVIEMALDKLFKKEVVSEMDENCELDDIRKCARRFLASFPHEGTEPDPLFIHLTSMVKERFNTLKSQPIREKSDLLEPLRRVFEESVESPALHKALYSAGFYEFILEDILQNPEADSKTCMEAVTVIKAQVENASDTQARQLAWFDVKAVDTFINLIKTFEERRAGFNGQNDILKRAPGFYGLSTLLGIYAEENVEQLFRSSNELIALVIKELEATLKPICTNLYEDEMDWVEIATEMEARQRPIELLDALTSVKPIFQEVRVKVIDANGLDVLKRVQDDDRDFEGYDIRTQDYLKAVSEQILERLSNDDQPDVEDEEDGAGAGNIVDEETEDKLADDG